MFYDDQNYKIINEYADPEQHGIIHLSIYCDDELDVCPFCGTRLKKKGTEKRKRKILEYNESKKRVEIIKLESQRYVCKNKECGHSFTSGNNFQRISHTKAFDRYLSIMVVTGDSSNLTGCGKQYGLSHTTTSEIVCRYLKGLHLHFSPPSPRPFLYLCPFQYQAKERYYLGFMDCDGNHKLITFFGYEDARKEVISYFRFHYRRRLGA